MISRVTTCTQRGGASSRAIADWPTAWVSPVIIHQFAVDFSLNVTRTGFKTR